MFINSTTLRTMNFFNQCCEQTYFQAEDESELNGDDMDLKSIRASILFKGNEASMKDYPMKASMSKSAALRKPRKSLASERKSIQGAIKKLEFIQVQPQMGRGMRENISPVGQQSIYISPTPSHLIIPSTNSISLYDPQRLQSSLKKPTNFRSQKTLEIVIFPTNTQKAMAYYDCDKKCDRDTQVQDSVSRRRETMSVLNSSTKKLTDIGFIKTVSINHDLSDDEDDVSEILSTHGNLYLSHLISREERASPTKASCLVKGENNRPQKKERTENRW